MNGVRGFTSRHPLAVFFILAYAISWSTVLPMGGSILPHGPTIAAIIVLALTTGRPGLSDLWRQTTRWRVRWIWYFVAPGLVLAFILPAFAVAVLLGATVARPAAALSWPQIVPVLLSLLILGGQWEEPGWSGFALPRFEERFAARQRRSGVLAASLALGLLRGGWHLPLVLYGHIPWFDALFFAVAFQIMITWLYHRTGRSVLIVMLFHLTSNIAGAVVAPLFTEPNRTQFQFLFTLFAWILALVILRAGRLSSAGRTAMSPAD